MVESHKRSLAKAVSWRITATLITTVIVWLATGEVALAAVVGAGDALVKVFVYYTHERLWNRIGYGRLKPPEYQI